MKNYILEIKNKKAVIKEDTATSVTTAQIGGAIKSMFKSTFGIAKTVFESMLATFVYGVSSIATTFASEETKKSVESKFKERRRKITDNYKSIIDDLSIQDGDAFMFLLSPSLYLYDNISKEAKQKGGIVGENLTEFLDDPFSYVVEFIPGLKKEIFGEEKKEELEKEFSKNKEEIKRVLNYLKKVGIDDLKKLSEDKTKLKYDQRQALKSILDYFEKNKDLLSDHHAVLKIGKKIILEDVNNSLEDILENLDSYNKQVKDITKKSTEKMSKTIEEEVNLQQQTVDELVAAMSEVLIPYKNMQKYLSGILTYFSILENSLKSNSLMKEEFNKKFNEIKDFNNTLDDEYKETYKECFINLKSLTENILKLDDITGLKKIIQHKNTNVDIMFNKISQENKKTINYLGDFFKNNFNEFNRMIESDKDLTDANDKEKINNSKNDLDKLEKYFAEAQKNIDDLANFFKGQKI